jgi:hypothetical protein
MIRCFYHKAETVNFCRPWWTITEDISTKKSQLFVEFSFIVLRYFKIFWEHKITFFYACQSVQHHTIQIIQPTRCSSFTGLLLEVYMWLNMFRVSSRPSSGGYNCTRSLWFYRWEEVAGALLVVGWPVITGWSVVGRGLAGYNRLECCWSWSGLL